MFDTKPETKPNGTKIVTTTLNKMRLCDHICKEKRDAADFEKLAAVLDMIEQLVKPPTKEELAPPSASRASSLTCPGTFLGSDERRLLPDRVVDEIPSLR